MTHGLTLRANKATLWTEFAFIADCVCGWTSGPIWRSRKAARRLYYRHKP